MVDLLGNRGVIVHSRHLTGPALKEAVEDLGYGAEILDSTTITRESKGKGKQASKPTRKVAIRVRGIFCGNCITQLNTHLSTLSLISYTPFTMDKHVTDIEYLPHQPLTIRDIITSLANVAPEFDAEVVRPQSLSERSQTIQRKEFKILGLHLLVAVIFAIPTFIV